MNIKTLLYIASAVSLAACSTEEATPEYYTVGEKDNAIALQAGIVEGGNGIASRTGAEDNHSKHLALTNGTKAALQVSGTWTGHDPVTVTKTPTANIGAKTGTGNVHNELALSPQLYWDDYGTADPANKETGRAAGLTIYAAAVDGVTTAPTVSSWTALPWTVDADQRSGWSTKDLLLSNNISASGSDGCYKFDDKSSGKLLEFTHAMSMITVNLTAGAGFADGKFVAAPKVTALAFNNTGTINVTTKANTPTATADIQTYRDNGTAWESKNKTSFTALVFPENSFADNTDILKVEADGNIYYVTAEKINAANTETNNKFEPGKNYIFNVIVNKTGIVVTATVKNWIDVTAETVEPLINVTTHIGDNTTDKQEGFTAFDFYLKEDATQYTKSATATGTKTDGETVWTFDTKQYWPSHDTHYHIRGVFPSGTTVTDGKIAVENGDYNAATTPSNLMIGMPEIADAKKMCNNSDHESVDMTEHGICAREASVNLNFRYAMSQVEVRLTTPGSGSNVVNLTNAKVEIIGGYTAGTVALHPNYDNRIATTGAVGNFTLNHITGENANYRHSIIVPQDLTDGLKFRITIYQADGTTVDDVYEAVVKNIKVAEGGAAPALISAWESGKHYVYTLDIRKTEIKVTATITDWATVEGSQDIWF